MYKKPLIQAIARQSFDVLRLDQIHPHVSGNKWYKLKHYLEQAEASGKEGLASFGGAYSNHLVALAFACKERNLRSLGIIRGEEPSQYGPSLHQMREFGMELRFIPRSQYKRREAHINEQFLVVPDGGAGEEGVRGAAGIMSDSPLHYTHIICAVGTGTTLAGLVNASRSHQQVIGVSCLKIQQQADNELQRYIDTLTIKKNYTLLFDYHFGGYAKKNDKLLAFMNDLYRREQIPTDFVYTAKLFYAVFDLLKRNYFAEGSQLLVIHSGGLQGNRSLPEGTLNF